MESKPDNCAPLREQFPEWLTGQLPVPEHLLVETHLAQCPACRQELATLQQMWRAMGRITTPEPSENLRPQFYSMLAEFQAEEAAKANSWANRLAAWWEALAIPAPALRVAYSVLLVAAGLAVGYGVRSWPSDAQSGALATTEAAAEQTPQDRNEQRIVLALLDNPSATQRLRGVSYTKNIGEVNQQVVNALLSTLNNDPNVNVRLATLDALAVLGQDPTVRQGLVHSLTKQDSPLVQSALADVMVQLQVRRSVKPMKQMLQQENLNEAVKTKIESSIQTLSNGRSAGPSTPADETPRSPQPRANDTVAA